MQIYLNSFISSSYRRKHIRHIGFTLIELLISFVIITTIASLVIMKYKVFSSTVLLKGSAYEIAYDMRQVQINAVNALQPLRSRYALGLSFRLATSTYRMFQFASSTAYPQYDIGRPGTVLSRNLATRAVSNSTYIEDVCITDNLYTETCASGGDFRRLDVSFYRPEYTALFYAAKEDGSFFASSTINSARIRLTGPDRAVHFSVVISKLGSVQVRKDD